jgi:hypothetical protein
VTAETKAANGTLTRAVQVLKKEDLKRLRAELALVADEPAAGSESASGSEGSAAASGQDAQDPFRAEILALLRSGKVHEDGRPTIDGRELIRFVSNDGHATYLIDAATYNPVEWRTTGDGGGTTLRFVAYEQCRYPKVATC